MCPGDVSYKQMAKFIGRAYDHYPINGGKFVCLENPTMETLDEIMNHPAVRLLVGTGGPGMVKTLMGSGKKVIAAGAGNPPCIINETADLTKAAAGLLGSASFDNNLLCIAEKEVFAVDTVFD